MSKCPRKSCNFFITTTEPSQAQVDALRSSTGSTTDPRIWTWTEDDEWRDSLSGKYIMKVEGDMVLQRLPERRYRLTINTVRQHVRFHRFVYKLDAFDGNRYLFTMVTPRFRHRVDLYRTQHDSLIVEGRVPPNVTANPTNLTFIRRGAGEWRD